MGDHESAFLARVTNAFHEDVVRAEVLNRDNLVRTDVLVGRGGADGSAPVADVDDDVAIGLNECTEDACEVGFGIGIGRVDAAFAFVEGEGEEVIVDGRRSCKNNIVVVPGNLHLYVVFCGHDAKNIGADSPLVGDGHAAQAKRLALGLRTFRCERFGLPRGPVPCIAKNGRTRLHFDAAVGQRLVQFTLADHQLAPRRLPISNFNGDGIAV